MKTKTMVCSFFKCSLVLRVCTVIFEHDKVSMSKFVKFEFLSMTLQIERVLKKMSQKQAKRAMNLESKKDHNQCKISYIRKKYFKKKIKSLYTINNICVVIGPK